MPQNKLLPPTSYQGGKQRIASQILDIISPTGIFHDFCCGSGAISIELVNRGYRPQDIRMLDISPWGLFWKLIGEGNFDPDKFRKYIDAVPKDPSKIQEYVKSLSKEPVNEDAVYTYLILQASSFGGKAIWITDNKWQNCSFRSFWQPTATSNRRSHVNPMMPMPETLFSRVLDICEKMRGIQGYHQHIQEYIPLEGVLYIDPPYFGTTFYGDGFNLTEYLNKLSIKTYVSEYKKLSADSFLISSARKKGGISGDRTNFGEEWLSLING